LPRTPVGKLSRHELRSQQKPTPPSVQPQQQLATGGRP
jgi:long-chain acyl-CoA synthetase